MTKERKESRTTTNGKGLSQSEQLKKDVRQVYALFGLATVSLIAFILVSVYNVSMLNEQTETVKFLNQYRIGSKTLTASVQSYAVTGDEQFYDAYMKELEVDKNRDIAWAGLEENDVSDAEWTMINNVASMSNNLVPLETAAMEAVAAGNSEVAIEEVFGSEYQETISKINSQTEELIKDVQERLHKKANVLELIQYTMCAIFVLCFIGLIRLVIETIRFADSKLLIPIMRTADILQEFSQGKLDVELDDLQGESGEVGQMVEYLAFMTQNLKLLRR